MTQQHPEFAAEQLLSDLGYALDELECDAGAVRCIAVTGSAGKTTMVQMASAVLREAGLRVGSFVPCTARAPHGILLQGQPVDAHDYANLDAVVQRSFAPDERSEATRLAVALALFRQAGCDVALLELQQPALAQGLPNLAAVLVGAIGEPEQQNVRQAAEAFRTGVPVITVAGQTPLAAQRLAEAAETAACPIITPDEADLSVVIHSSTLTAMDYGGYRVILPNFGRAMAQDAAAVVELALALWRSCGLEIDDEAILAGLTIYDPSAGPRVVFRKLLTLADPCHTALQAAALSNALREAGLAEAEAVLALQQQDDPESFFTALESGRLTRTVTEKEQLPGMTDSPINRVWLPLFFTPGMPDDLRDGAQLEQQARYHFEVETGTLLDQTVYDAFTAAKQSATVLCGSAAFTAEAEASLRNRMAEELLEGEAAGLPGEDPDYVAYRAYVMERFGALEEELTEEMQALLQDSDAGEALFDDEFDADAEDAPQPFAFADAPDDGWQLEPTPETEDEDEPFDPLS